MDIIIEKKKTESLTLSDALLAAERERHSILTESASVRTQIAQSQKNLSPNDAVRKEAENLEEAIQSASFKLSNDKRFLAERKADYEKLQTESAQLRDLAKAQRLAREASGTVDDGDEDLERIRALKQKIEAFESHQRMLDMSFQSIRLSQQCGANKRLRDIEYDLEIIGLDSRAKNLEAEIRQRQTERHQIEDKIRKLEQSIHVTEKRNSALLLRVDVQIAECEELNRSCREKIAMLTQEIENSKKELRKYVDVPALSASAYY